MNPAAFAGKQKNARRILDHIVINGETSRVTLAKTLGLSTATVTNIVTELLEAGLLYESRQTHSTAGRRTTLLQFNAKASYLITMDLASMEQHRQVQFSACDLSGELYAQKSYPCELTVTLKRSESSILKDLIAIARNFVGGLSPEIVEKIYAMGICVGGMVDANQNADAAINNWNSLSLVPPLQAALGFPVYAQGVTRAMALYETRFVDPSEKSVLYLNLSTGVGMVQFFGGKMVMGKTGIAGEVGHICLNPEGPPCFCGNRGCFEYYCGMSNVLSRAEELLTEENAQDVFYDLVVNQHQPLTAELLFRARDIGSLVVHELLREVAHYLGIGLTTLYNIFDPDRVIVSGYLTGADEFVFQSARTEASSCIINRFKRGINLSRAHLESNEIHKAISSFVLTKFLDGKYR